MNTTSAERERKVLFTKEHMPVYREGSVVPDQLELSRSVYTPESGYDKVITVAETSGNETIWQGRDDGIYDKVDSSLRDIHPCLVPRPPRRIVTGEQASDTKLCQMFCMIRDFEERLTDQGQINNFARQYPGEIHKVGAVVFATYSGSKPHKVFFVGIISKDGKLEVKKFTFLDKTIFPAHTWKGVLLHS